MIQVGRFGGGRRLLLASAGIGALGLALTLVGGLFRPRQALYSYLVAYTYWLGLALTAVILVAILHAAHTRWTVVLRRLLETAGLTLPLFALLFLPIALGMGEIFYWAGAGDALSPHAQEQLAHRRPWLNPAFFVVRALLYFAVWTALAVLLYRPSARQDETGSPALTRRQRTVGAAALPALGLTMTFACYDWMVSPSPKFLSQIIALYWFGGSMVGVLALLIVVGALARADELPGGHMNASHFHALGKLLLAFTAFWAWMAYSQFMLMWIANLPAEIEFWTVRMRPGWGWLGGFLIVGRFALPFFALLSRDLKRRPGALAAIAVWTLAAHYFDLYFILMPMLHEHAPSPWLTDLTAFLGIGGLALAACIALLRGRYALPVRDPFLGQSLRYSK
jgi:hypothetical protein